MQTSIRLEGEKEYQDAVRKLVRSVNPDKVEPVLMKAAGIVTKTSKRDAPVGPSGNLKKAVRTKKLKRYYGAAAPAISAIDRKKAPHAHLVHDGTGERVGKRGHPPYRGKRFGRMKAQPFHRNAWNTKRGEVMIYIEQNIKKMVEGAVR
jgi:HK97 gp10 family phage protein